MFNRWWIGLFASAGLVGGVAVGCGGQSTPGPDVPPEDTGAVDVGSEISLVDGGKDSGTDTGTAAKDTGDVPGSLFDAVIPDVVFDGGLTAAGCYSCLTDACKSEVATCDKDPRCRGLTLCILVECGVSVTDTSCLFGCALKYDVTSPSDPVATTALAVADCAQKKCGDKCPKPPADGGTGDSTSSDAATTDVKPESGGGGGGGGGGLPATPGLPGFEGKQAKSVDPKVIEMLSTMNACYASVPLASAGLVDHLKTVAP